MNLRLIRGYVRLTLALLILAAVAMLLIGNIGKGDDWTMWVFWRTFQMRPAGWLILAGLAGIVVWQVLWRLLPSGIRALRAGKAMEKPQPQTPLSRNAEEKAARE